MLSFDDVNVLGNIIDTSWSKFSTAQSPTETVKCQLVGDEVMKVVYTTVVNFANDPAGLAHIKNLEEHSAKVVDNYVKGTKKEFKSETGRNLKTKEISSDVSFEYIKVQSFIDGKRTAYFRRFTYLEVSPS